MHCDQILESKLLKHLGVALAHIAVTRSFGLSKKPAKGLGKISILQLNSFLFPRGT